MKKKKFRLRPHYIVLAALFLLLGISATMGKYTTFKAVDGTVKFQASLAKEVLLQEHKAVRQDDGSYVLSGDIVYKNDYILIPGLDIPKDPHIVISGKTDIPAYLFVEVVESLCDAIEYTINSDDWTLIEGLTGANGGKVYVYSKNGSAVEIDDSLPPDKPGENTTTIYILKGGESAMVTVGQKLLSEFTDTSETLTFYATLGEAAMKNTKNTDPDVVDVYLTIHSAASYTPPTT